MTRMINPYEEMQEQERGLRDAQKKAAVRKPQANARGFDFMGYIRSMNMKKVLLVAVAANLVFLGAYLSLSSLSASAADDKTAQAAPRKEAAPGQAQDMRAQLDSLKQREELLRVRQRELQLLESRIDEKIRRLTELETNVKAEIAMYKGISDERTKHLVKIYSSMKPNAAAKLMDQMDIDVATEVFLSMKGEVAGGILAYMEPAKAAAISKRLMSNRKMSSSAAPQALPQSAPAARSGEAPATAMTEPGAEPMDPATLASAPAEYQAPKAKARKKAWAKPKPWTQPAQVAAQTAPKAEPQAAVQQAAPQAAAQPTPLQPLTKSVPQPQVSVKAAAPTAAPQPAPQASAPQASATTTAPKAATQALAQTVAGQTDQK